MITAAALPESAVPIASSQQSDVRRRIAAIDVLRGVVMVLMVFDHTRETIYLHLQVTDPMDVASTAPALFFTRLAADFCAPVFVFLTGLSAWLYAHPANAAERSPRGFLFKRGLLLVALEWTLVSFAWTGEASPWWVSLQVIWAIGVSMIALALFAGLPRWLIACVGLVIVLGHNLTTPFHVAAGDPGFWIWSVLHERNFLIPPGGWLVVKVSYPVLPWIGVILLGYAAGPWYSQAIDSRRRSRLLVALGVASLSALLVLRGFDLYGETLAWIAGLDSVRTLMSFLNFTKYPPSLDFLLLTLGVAFLVLAWLESVDNWLTRALALYGGAPMFFYLLHLYVLLVLQKTLVATVGANHGERFGVDHIAWVWIVAVALAVALYFPTRAFANYKRRTSRAWVRYF